jgi:branched-chain amino acid transport system substrate-binding protein
MVLLNSVNAQLGAVGYTVAVEYAFYVFFALGFFSVVSVLVGEHYREIGRNAVAHRTDFWARVVFVGCVVIFLIAAVSYA